MSASRFADRLFGTEARRASSVAPDRSPPESTSSTDPVALALFSRLNVVVGLALVLALLLLRQPYRGVRHDSLLYTGQALSHVDPTWAAKDFFFMFGSQDQFSLFSNLLGVLIGRFGISGTEICLLLVGQAASLAAIWWLTADLSPARRWMALLAVATLPHFFGTGHTFSVLEPFLTARTAAEPLAILALAALVRGRLGVALVALAAAGLMHPLVAIPAAVVGWFFLIAGNRRWLWVALAIAPVAVLAWWGVAPFDRLGHTYDDVWMQGVMTVNYDAFLHTWDRSDATVAVTSGLVIWLAARGSVTPLARLARACVVATGALCAVSFIGVDIFQNVLLTQLQLWRVLWVEHLMFVLLLPSLVLDEWRRGPFGRLTALTLLFVVPALLSLIANSWLLMWWAVLLLVLSRRGTTLSPSIHRLALGATVAAGVGLCGLMAWKIAYESHMHFTGAATTSVWSIPFTLGALMLPLGASWLAAAARPRLVGQVATGAIAVALCGALWQFDQRTPFARYVESSSGTGHPFQALIPPGAQVYWEDLELAPIWFMLRRPSFLGGAQFSGLLFNRDTSRVAMGRWSLLAPISNQLGECSTIEGLLPGKYRYQSCELPEKQFLDICRAPDHADFLITHLDYVHPAMARWRFDPHDGSPAVTYYLHDCKTVH